MKRIDAKVVIPAHYYVEGVNISHAYGLESAEQWTTQHEHTMLDSPTLVLSPAKIAALHHHVMYFGNHVAFPAAGKAPAPNATLPPVPDPVRAWKRFEPKDGR
jgi:hypothetical protein